MWHLRELTAAPLPQLVLLDLAHPPPSVPHWVWPVPVFIKLLQAWEVDRGKVRAKPLPYPPPALAGMLSSRLAEFVLEVLPPDPPAEIQGMDCSGGTGGGGKVTNPIDGPLEEEFLSIAGWRYQPSWLPHSGAPSIHSLMHPPLGCLQLEAVTELSLE